MCEACELDKKDVQVLIEFPARGATYGPEFGGEPEYGVYAYEVWPDGSVNAGRERRRNRGRYQTLEEAQLAHPGAELVQGSCYTEHVDLTAPPDFDPLLAGESWDGE